MNRLALPFVILTIGCGNPLPTTPTATPTQAEPTKAAPTRAEDPKIAEFKRAVRAYLAEARAGLKLLSVRPSLRDMTDAKSRIQDLYSHLPATPAAFLYAERITNRLEVVAYNFAGIVTVAEVVTGGNMHAKLEAAHYAPGPQWIEDDCAEIERLIEQVRDNAKGK